MKIRATGKAPISMQRLIKLGDRILKTVGIRERAEVGLFFVSDREIAKLNQKYRKMNRPTDVLSFPLEKIKCDLKPVVFCHLESVEQPVMLGDIFISVETAKRQARQASHSLKKEIEFLFTHGLLHTLGLDHERSLQEERVWNKIANSIWLMEKR